MPPTRRSTRNKPQTQENGDKLPKSEPQKTIVNKRSKKENGNKSELQETTEPEPWQSATSIYDFSAKKLSGEEISLSDYKGKVCIIVNVASKCGHTKSNYEQFVELFEKYGDEKGLCILAFPCNQFGSQEPGDSKKIQEFIESKNVKFDVFEKINVNGKNAHELWKYLKENIPGPKGKDIKWNFTKFIINDEGQPVERFQPATKPLTLLDTLEKLW